MLRILPFWLCLAFAFGAVCQVAEAEDGLASNSRFVAYDSGGYDRQGEGYGSASGTHQRYGETYGRYNEPLGSASSTSAFGRYGSSGSDIHQRCGSYYDRYNEPVGQSATSSFGGWGSGSSATASAPGNRMLRMYMMKRAYESRENPSVQNENQRNIESPDGTQSHLNIQTPNGTQTYNTTSSTAAAHELANEVSNDFSAILQNAFNSIQNGGMRFQNGNNAPSPYAGTRYVAPVGAEPLPYHSQGLIPEFTTYASRSQ